MAVPLAGAVGTAAGAEGAGDVRLPAFERFTLPNGARVALLEKHDTPLIAVTALLRGGALGDAPGQEGSASLAAELLQKGAGERDAASFAEALENVGAELRIGASTEALVASASFLAKDQDLMLGLLADALQRPRLDPAEFEKLRTRAIQSILAAKDADPRQLIGTYGGAWLFGEHPYGRPSGGSEASLQSIGIGDVERYLEQQTGGDRLVLAVVGDFSPAGMRQRLERDFGSWRRAASPPPEVRPAAPVEGRHVLLVDKPGATQTYFWLGNVGRSRLDPGRDAQALVNTVFGGRFTSMLNSELRIKSGLTYGAFSGFDRLSQPGAFGMMSFTPTESTVQAIDLTLQTLDRLHREGLSPEMVDSARNYLLGQFPPTIETNGQLARRIADLMFYGLGPEDVDGFAGRLRSLDAQDANSAIGSAFPTSDNLAIVLLGDADSIREDVRRYGPVIEMRLDDPRFHPATVAD
jgi:predicted Zn-dependent peptidase